MIAVVYGLFGLVVGSFLNVVILRYGQSVSWRNGRSECPHCHAQLRWHDLIPVLSWLLLRGRCRYCHTRISVQYPLVEAATALLFAGIGSVALPPLSTLLSLAIAALLICIFAYDLRHKLIPDAWVWSFCLLAVLSGLLWATTHQLPTITWLLAGPVAALPILFLWYLSRPFTGSAGQWMGFGDVKLSLGIGWLLGFPDGLIAIFFAFIIGAVISVCILLPLPHLLRFCGIRTEGVGAGYTMKSEVPFGPFLIASCVIVWFAALYTIQIPLLL